MGDSTLDKATPIEHLVAKRRGLFLGISPIVRWVFPEDSFDVGTKRHELFLREDTMELDVPV